MIASHHERVAPRDIASVLFRHWRKSALFFTSVVALSLIVIALYPRSYSSESKLFIQVGRETVALDPTATTGQTMLLQKSQVDEINSALDILTSNEVQQRVVEMVGSGRILDDEPASGSANAEKETLWTRLQGATARFRASLDSLLMSIRLKDSATVEDLAVRRLNKGMRVWAAKESTIITVTYQAASPQLAHDVVEAATKAFLEQHLRLNRVEGSLEFFAEQTETLHAKLVTAQTDLRDRKNDFQMASLAGKQEIFEGQIQDVELQLLSVQRDLAFSSAMAADLMRSIGGLEPEIVTNRVAGFANEARDGMREKLYELELQETKLSSSYQDNHPLLVQVRRQRQQAEEILAAMPDDRTQTTSSLNSNQRILELELYKAEADVKALEARQQSAQQQLGQLHEQLHALNDWELQIGELERNVAILESEYRMHAEKLEQARVNDELARGRITNVKLAQPATISTRPAAPNKRLLMAFGLFVATAGAFGLTFLAEAADQTARTTDQVEKELGLPVLMSIPKRHRGSRRRGASASNRVANGANGHPQGEQSRQSLGRYGGLIRELLGANASRAKVVGIAGCGSSAQRRRVAANIARRAAASGAGRVLLIDSHGARRRATTPFVMDVAPSWREALGGVAGLDASVRRPRNGNPALAPEDAAVATLTAEPAVGISEQVDAIKSEYALIVVDLPPGREWDGPPMRVNWLDEVVLVLEAEQTRIPAARRVKETYERAGVHLTGAVLANLREFVPGWLFRRL